MVRKEFHNKIIKINKLMSLESKVNVLGSANIKRNLYYSDIDSFETEKVKMLIQFIIISNLYLKSLMIQKTPLSMILNLEC